MAWTQCSRYQWGPKSTAISTSRLLSERYLTELRVWYADDTDITSSVQIGATSSKYVGPLPAREHASPLLLEARSMHRPERRATRTFAQATQAQRMWKSHQLPASKTPISCGVSLLPAFMDSFLHDFSRISIRDVTDVAEVSPPKTVSIFARPPFTPCLTHVSSPSTITKLVSIS